MSKLDILICDDHEIFRRGISTVLSDDVNIIGEAENGLQCLSMVEELKPDILLLDVRMPKMNGIECIKELRKQENEVKVLAITQFDEQRLVKQMIKYGANGYVLKHTTRDELLRAFVKVREGHTYLSPEIDKGDLINYEVKGSDKLFPDLSERELEIIKLVCEEHSNKQIAEKLFLSVKTVELHRTKIFKKIGIKNLAGLVRWAMENDVLIS